MCTVTYHYSPSTRRDSILKHGLVIGSEPCVNGVEDDHRNPWISLSSTAAQAWFLSGESLSVGGFTPESCWWDLWEVNVNGLESQDRIDGMNEVQILEDIAPQRLRWIGQRPS